VLEGVLVEVYKLIVVVGVNKEVAVLCKYVGCAYVGFWQENICGVAYLEDFLWIVVQVLSGFVAQVRIRISVTHDFYRILYANGAMVGSYDERALVFGYFFQNVE